MPRFLSIVTISFNQAQFLRQCVDSVVSQKGDDVEYIVVDPGSTDGSRDILQSYGNAIDHLILEPDKGPADGLNKGFARAAGRYGYFINSDDYLLPGAIDRLRRLWQLHGAQADALLCGAWMVDGDNRPIREARPMPVDLQALLEGRAVIVQHGWSFRMEDLRAAGGFNPLNRTCWDYELLCALAARGIRFRAAAERIGVFRLYGGSLTGGVAGATHMQRFRSDLGRIYRQYAGHEPTRMDLIRQKAGPWLKHAANPRNALATVLDRLLPQRMARRWQSDIASAERGGASITV